MRRARWITQALAGVDSPRRRTAGALALVAALVVAMVLAVRLHDTIARDREDVARNRLVLDVARARVADDVTLARASVAAKSDDLRAAIERVFASHGLRYAALDAQVSEGVLRVVLEAAPFDVLVRALDALSREEGVRVTDATLTARVDRGTVRAELALAR
jgi:type II secretory pathway component PulM